MLPDVVFLVNKDYQTLPKSRYLLHDISYDYKAAVEGIFGWLRLRDCFGDAVYKFSSLHTSYYCIKNH